MLALTFQEAKIKESNAKLKKRPEKGGNKDVNNDLYLHTPDQPTQEDQTKDKERVAHDKRWHCALRKIKPGIGGKV